LLRCDRNAALDQPVPAAQRDAAGVYQTRSGASRVMPLLGIPRDTDIVSGLLLHNCDQHYAIFAERKAGLPKGGERQA